MTARLSLRGIVKDFGVNRVLRGIDLDIAPGAVVALMGANGAGKSTLVKIIGGVHGLSSGRMRLNGRPFAPASPSAAIKAGVVTVHQAINDGVILSMTVAENLMIDRLCAGETGPFARRSRLRVQAAEIAARAGLDVPLNTEVGDLSLADRQLVGIARALAHEAQLLILDEPTSALSATEAERLFAVIARIKADGVSVLYISHRMGDIRRVADRLVTLRDGGITGDFRPPLDYTAAVDAMLGAALAERAHRVTPPGAPVLRLAGLRATRDGPPIDLTLHAGQITALVGLIGAGKSELAECLYGLRRPLAGTMTLDGAPFVPQSPQQAIRHGVYLAAEDRANDSLVMAFDLARNIALPFTAHFSAGGFMRTGAERGNARALIERLGIVATGPRATLDTLSGGNQQKSVLARWLTRPCRLLILDEPFQGVDIRARRDIGRSLRASAQERATLLLCADLDEALEVADRIVVLSHGALVGDHAVDHLARETVVAQMAGANVAAAPR